MLARPSASFDPGKPLVYSDRGRHFAMYHRDARCVRLALLLASVRSVAEVEANLAVAIPQSAPRFENVAARNLLLDGVAADMFRCRSGDAAQADQSHFARESVDVMVRKLSFSVGNPGDNSLLGSLGGGSDPEPISVSNVRLNVVPRRSGSSVMPILYAAVEPALATTAQRLTTPFDMNIVYDCWDEGESMVEIRTDLQSGSSSSELCLAWIKACGVGWNDLSIQDVTDSRRPMTVFQQGIVEQSWVSTMEQEGTFIGKTRLSLSSPTGNLRIRSPQITTSREFLQADIFVSQVANDQTAIEVGGDELSTELSVVYTCNSYGGWADVTLLIEKVSLVQNARTRPQQQLITWRKFCGLVNYPYLTVRVKGSMEHDAEAAVAVEGGVVKPSFLNPCRIEKDIRPPANCTDGQASLFEVPADQMRTVLELKITAPSAAQTPVFETPDVSWNHSMMKVSLPTTGQHMNLRKPHKTGVMSQSLIVRYICYWDGVSRVQVTLHIRGFKPVELAWMKRCVEPRVQKGRALTAQMAMLTTLGVCFVIACIVVCSYCWCCPQAEPYVEFEPEEEDPLQDGIEMRGRKYGRTHEGEEVVFH